MYFFIFININAILIQSMKLVPFCGYGSIQIKHSVIIGEAPDTKLEIYKTHVHVTKKGTTCWFGTLTKTFCYF